MMEDDKNIIHVYVCSVCGRQFKKIENCQACVKSHEGEMQVLEVRLGMKISDGRLQNYGFLQRSFKIKPDSQAPKTDVEHHGLYGGYPHFSTECMDTPMELMMAKSRLLKAAAEWAAEYAVKVKKLLDELEQGGDGK